MSIKSSSAIAVDFINAGPPFINIEKLSGQELNNVNGMIRDSQGFIWLVNNSGLLRFDGNEFKLFPGLEQFTPAKVDDVVEGQDGRIWIATYDKGLALFDTNSAKLSFFDLAAKFDIGGDSPQINTLFYQHQYLYLASKNNVIKIDEQNLTVVERYTFPLEDDATIVRLLVTSNGDIWCSANPGKGVIRLNQQGFTHFEHQPHNITSISSSFVLSIYEDSQKRIWFGGIAGLDVFLPESNSFLHFKPLDVSNDVNRNKGALANFVLTIDEDNEGALWLGLVNNGVVKFLPESKTFEHYPHINGISSTVSTDSMFDGVSIDNQQTVWVSTSQGLGKLPQNNRKVKQLVNVDKDTCIAGALHDNRQGLLFACNKSLYRREQQQVNLVHDFNEKIISIYQDKKQNIWLGTVGGGVYRYNVTEGTSKHYGFTSDVNEHMGVNYVHHLRTDSNDDLYGLTAKHTSKKGTGIIRYDRTQDKFLTFSTELEIGGWVDIDKSKLLLIASYSSESEKLYWFYKKNQNIEKMPINTGHVLASIKWREQLWVSTEKLGLIVIDVNSGKWHKLGNKTNEKITGFYLDSSAEYLYLTANNQLYKLNSQTEKHIEISCITCSLTLDSATIDDPQIGQLTKGNALLTHNNNFFISNENILLYFPINELVPLQAKSQLLLTNYKVEGKSILPEPNNEDALLKQNIENTKSIVIPPETTFFSLRFAQVGAGQPERIKYAYKMQGLNKDWVYASANHAQADYSLLPAGQYVFKVKSSSNTGQWEDETVPLSLDITVLPPWWKTWWAYSLYLGCFLYLFGLFYRTKMAEKERQASMELVNAKEQLFANISHEFRTPLTLILGPVKAIALSSDDRQTQHNVKLIERNALRLLSMVEQLLKLAQLKNSEPSSNTTQQVAIVCHFVMQTFDVIAREKQITLKLENIIDDSWWVSVNPNALETILYNLISNGIKFTDVGGHISLEVSSQGQRIEFKVTDSGCGIAKSDQKKIFERFTRLENSNGVQGTGIGLALTKELIDHLGGTITVESEIGKGACFKFTLPRVKPSKLARTLSKQPTPQKLPHKPAYTAEQLGAACLSEAKGKDSIQLENNPNLEVYYFDNDNNLLTKPSVLIVDDNSDMREFIKSGLTNSYVILEAENGQQALDSALKNSPDLIISDVMMPVMDGFELLKSIRNEVAVSHIPIILLTAKVDQQSKLKGLSDLADDYITKPFDGRELLMRVQRLLEIRVILQKRFADINLLTAAKNSTLDLSENTEASNADVSDNLSAVEQRFLQRFTGFIEQGYTNPELTLPMISTQLAMSDRQLQRKLKAISGYSFNEILREYRLSQGRQLLNSGEQIAVIADKVGFTSSSYFVRCFKAKYGKPPNDYRKAN
ncbi:hybrid sensor histidine kinase/response regulator transcription factor [Paraglaciecola arctica]|uniref:histidine kinase n=1 Tax=Paraglaciecola arctica BSs20135 TaxID=493475 RepID=K6XIH6_9ALTE|nr:ATP-binding protein [Paraglaciecola arctica]GAC20454.1 hypothetical protein GARC_3499 [Paraglaciecola arctica BSs20135]